MAELGSRLRPAPELGVAALVAAASLPLSRLFREGGITPTILGACATSAFLAWTLRRARIIVVASAILSAAAFVWWAGFALFPDTLWGPFPTTSTFRAIGHALAEGIGASKIEISPVPSSPEFLLLAALAVWALAWAADDAVQKLRHPLLAVAFTLPVFVFPGTLLESDRRWFDVALYVAAALWVLFTDERSRLSRWGRHAFEDRAPGWRPGLAARMGAVVVVASIALAPLIPGYARPPGISTPNPDVPGGGTGRFGLNPLVSIRPRLQQLPIIPLFTVTSKVASYWRVTSLERFDGKFWVPASRPLGPPVSGRTISPTVRAPRSVRLTQSYEIRNLAGPWIPAAFDPVRVDGIRGVRAEPVGRSLIVPSQFRSGQRFRVTSVIALPDAGELDPLGAVSDRDLEPFLRLPRSTPPQVEDIARGITKDAPTPFRQALALQDHLRSFIYDEDVAAGHSFDDVLTFLTKTRRGYCEQFAGTMAVLARTLGLPSRVAIGYAVGEAVAPDRYRVTTRHAHAWVEIFFPTYGWLAFEPTPRPDSTIIPSYTQASTLAPPAGDLGRPTPTASPSPGEDGIDPRVTEREEAVGPITAPERKPAKPWLIVVPIAAALGAGLPGVSVARRLLRRRRARTTRERVVVRYLDFLDWCASVRLPRSPGETPAEYARRLAAFTESAEAPLVRFAAVTSDALYSPAGAADPEEARRLSRSAQQALARALPIHVRVLPVVGWGWWRNR